MEEISKIISQFGFPAAVCFYLMNRVIKSIDKNTTALDALKDELRRILTEKKLK